MAEVVQLAPGISGITALGDGPRVLWLHGYTLDSRSWDVTWGRLPGWSHLGVDLPWHRSSEGLPEGHTLTEYGLRLAELCQRESIEHVVGLSFGTVVATELGIRLGERLKSLVLAAPSLAGGPHDPDVSRAYGQMAMLYGMGVRGEPLKRHWMRCRAWRGLDQREGLEGRLGGLIDEHSWAELQAFRIRALTLPPHTEERLRTIAASTLVLVGEHEMPAFRETAGILERVVPRCRRVELEATDHLCILQSPEASAREIEGHVGSATR